MANTATKTFVNYKSDVLSFEVANEMLLGILEPGRIRGFDNLFVTQPGLVFGLSHEVSGIKKVAKDGITESGYNGIIYTRQGTIAHVEDLIEGLAVLSNAGETEECISVVYFQHNYISSTAPNLGLISIIPGVPGAGEPALTLPTKQVKIGIITMPADASEVLPAYWTPATVKQVGGKDVASYDELSSLLASAVLKTTDQEIFGVKTFRDAIQITNPWSDTAELIDTALKIGLIKKVVSPGTIPSGGYIRILQTISDTVVDGVYEIIIRVSHPYEKSTYRYTVYVRGALNNAVSYNILATALEFDNASYSSSRTYTNLKVYTYSIGTVDYLELLFKPQMINAQYTVEIVPSFLEPDTINLLGLRVDYAVTPYNGITNPSLISPVRSILPNLPNNDWLLREIVIPQAEFTNYSGGCHATILVSNYGLYIGSAYGGVKTVQAAGLVSSSEVTYAPNSLRNLSLSNVLVDSSVSIDFGTTPVWASDQGSIALVFTGVYKEVFDEVRLLVYVNQAAH